MPGNPFAPEMDLGDFIRHHLTQVYHLPEALDARLHSLIREFRDESEQRQPGYRHRMRAICTNLTIEVCRKCQPAHPGIRPAEQDPAMQIVMAAREYIEKHYRQPLTLGEIAWHVGKGEEYLARLFKRHTGQSVFDTVREVRVDAAKPCCLILPTASPILRKAVDLTPSPFSAAPSNRSPACPLPSTAPTC